MANTGAGGLPQPKGTPTTPKGVVKPKVSTPFKLGQAPPGVMGPQKPKAPRPKAAPIYGPTQPRKVAVKAHTRTVTPRKAAAPVSVNAGGGAPAVKPPKPLPATTDKPTRNGFYTRQADVPLAAGQTLGFTPGKGFYARTGPHPAAGNQTNPYAGVELYQNQTPEQLAQAALAPQYAQVADQTAAEQQAMQSFTTAILQQLQQYPGQVQQGYTDAANQIQGFAGQAAQALAGFNPNAQDQAMLKAIGAPASQQRQVAGQLQNEFGGGAAALQGIQGLLPARSLAEQGAAANAYAAAQPGIQGLAGEQAMKNLLYQASQQRAQIGTQYPGLVNSYATAKSDSAAKQYALEQNAQALHVRTGQQNFNNRVKLQQQGFNNQVTLARLNQKQAQFISTQKWKIRQFNAKQTDAASKQELPSASLSRARGVLVDAAGNEIVGKNGKPQVLPGFTMKPDGQVVKVTNPKQLAKPTAANPFPNLSKKQQQELRSGIANGFYGVQEQKDASGKVTNPALPPLPYEEAIKEAVLHGYSRAAATRMANRFYMPGQRGRPRKARNG